MRRRDFVKRTLSAAAGLAAAPIPAYAGHTRERSSPATPFRLHYAPSFGQFKAHAGTDLVAQIDAPPLDAGGQRRNRGAQTDASAIEDVEAVWETLRRVETMFCSFEAHGRRGRRVSR